MTATVRGISPRERAGSINRQGVTEYTVVYLVTTDDRNDGPQSARTAFGIPGIGDVYQPGNDFDPTAVVVDKRVRQMESPWEWEVEITYSTSVDQDQQSPESPLDEPPDITYGFQGRQILIPGQYNNPDAVPEGADLDLGIVAPNGELFDPQPETEWMDPVLTIKRNVASIVGPELMALANCVNESEFMGADARQLKMSAPQAQSAYHESVGQYWAVTYGMAYRYDTWDIQLVNQGTFYLDSGTPKPFLDSQGNRRIGLLSTDGTAINSSNTDSAGRYISGGDAPTFTRIRFFREIDFNNLGLF